MPTLPDLHAGHVYASPLDPGIADAVAVLRQWGVETYESCEGGERHAFPEPTVLFHGPAAEGFRALAVAMQHGLPVWKLQRIWRVEAGEPTGPAWGMVFHPKSGLSN